MTNFNFPRPSNNEENLLNPINTINSFVESFNSIYKDHFNAIVLTNTTFTPDDEVENMTYSLWITFLKKDNYQYRFIEFSPKNKDGGYPIQIKAYNNPSIPFDDAKDSEELNKRFNEILNHPIGKFILLSNY